MSNGDMEGKAEFYLAAVDAGAECARGYGDKHVRVRAVLSAATEANVEPRGLANHSRQRQHTKQ